MSANEIRALEDLNQIEAGKGGDDYLVNGNMITVAKASKTETASDGLKGEEQNEQQT